MKSAQQFETHSDEETRAVGRQLATQLKGVVLLIGDLGAGKTTLAKGIVEGTGAANADEVSSPTFTLIHEYGNPVKVYHADLYRLDTSEQVRRLGIEELFDRPALVLIEWGERFPDVMPLERTEIRMCHISDESRLIRVDLHLN
jgi:tRNA threonylcarbamoyladenosine biosynthesis protein TsaE